MPAGAARRRVLRRLLEERVVSGQAELVELLAGEGHRVAQATVSRDLDALGAFKAGDGRYVIPRERPREAERELARRLAGFVESIAAAGNLVVLKTPPGAAQIVAAAIDRANPEGVLGTVAGDDTVLAVADEEHGGRAVAGAFERWGAAR